MNKIEGKIINNRYENSEELFSFDIPKIPVGMQIIESSPSPKLHHVQIQDEWGGVVRVEVSIFSQDEMSKLLELCPDIKELSHRLAIDPILNQFPKTKILEEKYEDIKGVDTSYFAFIEVPGGSTVKENGNRLDSRRAYYISFESNYLVCLSMQESMIESEGRKFCGQYGKDCGPQIISEKESLYNKLIQLRHSFRINSKDKDAVAKISNNHMSLCQN